MLTPMQAARPRKRFKNSWFPAFLFFLSQVKIPSKEMLEPGPIDPYDAQLRFLYELDDGLAAGQHAFVCLKARQLGISTILLALDVFWLYMHKGLQGGVVADNGKNLETFRETITQLLDNMPKGFRIPVKRHNSAGLVLQNDSRLQYMAAGAGKNSNLGRSRGLAFLHASEVSSYGDPIGFDSLVNSLATENPNRLFVYESTALGYNLFYDLWRLGVSDPKMRAFFIGWWAKELYRIPESDPEFAVWWGAQPFLDEVETIMAKVILEDYGHEMRPEQWAWWRKKLSTTTATSLLQEFPWCAKVAFQVTGHSFFSQTRVSEDMSFLQTGAVTFDGYRYTLGDSFLTMRCDPVYSGLESDLRVWEGPVRNAKYVMGVDVAYGRSDTADRHCIQVFRCYADKMVQVAEWATNQPETRQVAWVLAHLAGSYRDCMINLEVSGPGLTVMQEVKHLREQIATHHLRDLEPAGKKINAAGALDLARWFLYHRPDTPGQGYMYNWKTNFDNKIEMFNGMRDEYNSSRLVIRGSHLLEEMTTLVQNGTSIGASGRNKDDRPFAAGLACYAWRTWVRFPMMAENRTFEIEMRKQQEIDASGGNVVQGIIPFFFQRRQAERAEADFQRLLNS